MKDDSVGNMLPSQRGAHAVEICDGCHVSKYYSDLMLEFVPCDIPDFPSPFELKLWCPECFVKREKAKAN